MTKQTAFCFRLIMILLFGVAFEAKSVASSSSLLLSPDDSVLVSSIPNIGTPHSDFFNLPPDTIVQYSTIDGETQQPDSAGNFSIVNFFVEIGKKGGKAIKKFNTIDSLYIEPNHYDWTAMVQNTNFFQVVGLSGKNEQGKRQTINFMPRSSYRLGPYIGWRWIFLGYTIDMSRLKGAGKTTEFNFSVYTNKVGGDLVYVKNANDFSIRNIYGFEGLNKKQFKGSVFSGLSTYTLSLNAYYVANHRKFSYPAAYNQSTVQKKSAGSFFLGFRYDRQRIYFQHEELPAELLAQVEQNEELKFKTLKYSSYCVNVGYGYNWVFARNCLFAVSLAPAIGVKRLSGEKITGKSLLDNMKRINFDFLGRVGLVWNTQKKFAGVSLISHFYDYRNNHFSVGNSINFLNFYVGFYFGRTPEQRK